MSSDDKNDKRVCVMQPYQEMMESPLLICGGPLRYYKASKPREVFEIYRDSITEQVRKKWPNLPANTALELAQGAYYNNGYGGRYNFGCYIPDVGDVHVTIIEPFEPNDGELANDMTERKRRAQITVS